MCLLRQADKFQNRIAAALGCGHAKKPGLHFQRFARGEIGIDVQFLRHDADIGARLTRVAVNIRAPHADRTGRFDDCSGQNIDEGGFAGTIRTKKPENTPHRNIQRHIMQRCLWHAAGICLLQIAGAYGDSVFRCSDKGLGHVKTHLVEQRILSAPPSEDDDTGCCKYMGMMIGFCMLW